MKITVCELSDDPEQLTADWPKLVAHVSATGSEIVVLPEMPFHPWWMTDTNVDDAAWDAAMAAHATWESRLHELSPACVLTTFPARVADRRFNEALLWHAARRTPVHQKYFLPDEPGFRESTWYHRGDGRFQTVAHGAATIGFLICSELWSFENARRYGADGAQLIVTPRATRKASLEKWIVAGRAAALVSGAFSISSNRCGTAERGVDFSGAGWVIDPDGAILALTSPEKPFVTVEIDLAQASAAKRTYPRNILF